MLLLGTGGVRSAAGVQLHVSGSTTALFDELQAWDGSLLTRRRIVQQLQLGAHDLAGDGRSKLSFGGILRIDTDFGVSREEALALDGYRERSLAIPYLTLQGRELWHGRLDLSLGRQLLVDEQDFALFDGAAATLRGPWHLGLEAFGGLLVRREVSLAGLEDLEPDGVRLGAEDAPVCGGSVLLHGLDWLRGRIRYRQERQGSDLARSALLFSGGLRPFPWVSLDGEWVRDLLWQRDEELAAGLTLTMPAWLRWKARFARLTPHFDAGSIFSSFQAGPMQSWSLHGEALLGSWLVALGVIHRLFLEQPEPGASADGRSAGLDLLVRWQLDPQWQVHGNGSLRQGYGGSRSTLAAGCGYSPGWLDQASFDGVARWVHLSDDLGSWRSGELFALDLSASLLLWERARLQLVLEQASGPWRPWWLRALALLDLGYWR